MEYTIWLHAQVQRLLLKELGWLVKVFKLICELCDKGALSDDTWRCVFGAGPSRSSFALDPCDTRANPTQAPGARERAVASPRLWSVNFD